MRFYLALYLARLLRFFFNILKPFVQGAGFTRPGLYALKVYPDILKDSHVAYRHGIVLISGTNGKTTTAKLLVHILEKQGYRVTCNKTGSNLLRGIASAVLLDTDWKGEPKTDIAVLEVDEFTLPLLLKFITPRVLLLLNLSRDQLDRYAEIDTILARWAEVLFSLPEGSSLIINKEQPEFIDLAKKYHGQVLPFGPDREALKVTRLQGHFNALNVGASVKAAEVLGVERSSSLASLENFEAAYGRGELISYRGLEFTIFLAKNPASFNHNLELLITAKDYVCDSLFFVLNDKIPDGRDVSWIYDVRADGLYSACKGKKIYVSGDRGLDMAIRLKYAGVKLQDYSIQDNTKNAIKTMLRNKSSKVLVLPNYSAMLDFRKLVTGRNIL